jgi:uncharacterized membrane protein YidH (DUF202 family)
MAYFVTVKLKAIAILLIIIVSLLPVYLFYKWLEKKLQPKESFRRFLIFLFIVLAVIFCYTFLVVLLIHLVFPGA